MGNSKDWKPELYLKYRNERTQPSIDLVNKISMDFVPENIIDLGCGPGNSSQVLVQRWLTSYFVGVDNSVSMIEKAKMDYPNQEWVVADASNYKTDLKFDLVFSNATIQWIPNHENLLSKFHELLSDRGILAIQIPMFWDMPLAKAIEKVSKGNRWKTRTKDVLNLFTIHDYFFYYDQLSGLFNTIDMWETDYMHILDSQNSILEMIKSTGLKPYLERIEGNAEKLEFEEEVLNEIKRHYPLQKNGKVIFPFKRLFFIGYQ
jgi:trans-aconitate 2-methyltransferase